MSLAYRTGTVAVTNGSATVTGTTTGWASQVLPGDLFTLDGTRWAEVLSVASNTSLTLATSWGGSTASGQAYAIVRCSPQWSDPSDVAQKLATFLDTLALFPVVAVGDALKYLRANAGGTAYEFVAGPAAPRERLTAARTYYVRADGSDANTGLANTSGAAFRQIQKAINVAATLDLNGFNVTINVAAGTYNGIILARLTGNGACIIVGDTSTPANVQIAGGGANAIYGADLFGYDITGVTVTSTGSSGIYMHGASIITRVIEFGACASVHVRVDNGGAINQLGAMRITGGATYHVAAEMCGIVQGSGLTVTLVGTPAFSQAYALANRNAAILMATYTYVGSATGQRYRAIQSGVIDTVTAAAPNTLPGNSAGTSTGGDYN